MVIVIVFSAYLPARRASKITPIEAIRQNDDIKIKRKKVKTSKLITKLFGIEGELALKNIKRNKRKYRITTLSLIVSISMFVAFSGYLIYGVEGANDYVGSIDYDIELNSYSDNVETFNNASKIFSKIINHEQVKDYVQITGRYGINFDYIDEKYYSDDYLKRFKENDGYIIIDDEFIMGDLISVSDDSYEKLKNQYNLKNNQPILLNYYETIVYTESTRKVYKGKIFNNSFLNKFNLCDTTDVFPDGGGFVDVSKADCSVGSIDNIYVTSDIPFGFSRYLNNQIIVIVNNTMFEEIINKVYPDNEGLYRNTLILKAPKYDKLESYIDDLITYDIYYQNISEELKLQNNIILTIEILFYGFIALVTLIGVTSVFNTINTSINLRRREFAMLRSMGLTPFGFNKMLCFESIFFGIKSLLYGIPIAILLIYLMHLAMDDMVQFSEILIPYKSILIAILGVFIIVFITMMYSTRKIKKENILEAIREENI